MRLQIRMAETIKYKMLSMVRQNLLTIVRIRMYFSALSAWK